MPDLREPRFVRLVRLAIGGLTTLPAGRFRQPVSERDLAASRFAFPLVGAYLGLILAAVQVVLERWGVGEGPSAWVIVAMAAGLTGGLHLDGLADTADGLFLAGGPDRRLSAMRDPRIGSFGVIAVVLVLLGKYAALGNLSVPERVVRLIGAFAVSRTLLIVAAGSAPYARPEGTGRTIIDAGTPGEALIASAGVCLIGALTGGSRGLLASLASLAVVLILVRVADRRIGGITGDILGAAVELAELTYLL